MICSCPGQTHIVEVAVEEHASEKLGTSKNSGIELSRRTVVQKGLEFEANLVSFNVYAYIVVRRSKFPFGTL